MEKKREKIMIEGKAYKVGFSFMAIREFEKLMKKSVEECLSTWDNLMFLYCTLIALNEDFTMTEKEFVRYSDDNPEIFQEFMNIQIAEQAAQANTNIVEKKKSLTLTQITTSTILKLWMLFLLLSVSPALVPIISIICLTGTSLWLLLRLIGRAGRKPDL